MIYFYGDDNKVKIGFSGASSYDRVQAQLSNTTDHFFAAMSGLKGEEERIHRHFDEYNIRQANGGRELFHNAGHLREYVEWVMEQPWAAAEKDDIPNIYPYPYRFPWNRREAGAARQEMLPVFAHLSVNRSLRERRRNALFIQLQSESDDYITPPIYIEAARRVMGAIDLDPASTPIANRVIRASAIFTIKEDGLSHQWNGRIWLNPPYGGYQKAFVAHAVNEYKSGRLRQVIMCLNSHAKETEWFSQLWTTARAMCETHHRPKFAGGASNKTPQESAPTTGTVFVYIGPNVDAFFLEFGHFGYVYKDWQQPLTSQEEFRTKISAGEDWNLPGGEKE